MRFGEIQSQATLVARAKQSTREYFMTGAAMPVVLQRSPSTFPVLQNTDKAHSFDSHTGRRSVTPLEYASAITALRPTAASCLADEVPFSMGSKRQNKAVSRTLSWLDTCLATVPTVPASGDAESAGSSIALFATAMGGADPALRRVSAVETAKRPIAGVWVGGIGLGESPEDRIAAVIETLQALPPTLARLAACGDGPLDILHLVDAGVDAVDSDFPKVLSQFGYAACFLTDASSSPVDGCSGADRSKLCVRDKAFCLDARPLVPGCTCYTCTHHSRAYLHHLLNVHEMLAPTLLQCHNTHHFLRFFDAIRAAIAEDRFPEYKRWFADVNSLA